MKVIRANCRIQFTEEDVQFILSALGELGNSSVLIDLLADENTRDLILDDEKLYRAVLEQTGCLQISSHFYFYILTRHVLLGAGIEDRNVADYVAELLVEFSETDRMHLRLPGQSQSLDYIFEMLGALQTADDKTAFVIRAHIGNHSLFFTGVFFEHLEYRRERRGAPGLSYYQEMGRANYLAASDHHLARRFDLVAVYSILAEQFDSARAALNELKDRLLCTERSDFRIHSLLQGEA